MKAEFIFEKINFEREGDPLDKLRIGHRVKQEELIKKYERVVELIQRSRYIDLQSDFAREMGSFRPKRFEKKMGWGNMDTKINEFTHEEYLEFAKIVDKYWNKISPEYRIEIQ